MYELLGVVVFEGSMKVRLKIYTDRGVLYPDLLAFLGRNPKSELWSSAENCPFVDFDIFLEVMALLPDLVSYSSAQFTNGIEVPVFLVL